MSTSQRDTSRGSFAARSSTLASLLLAFLLVLALPSSVLAQVAECGGGNTSFLLGKCVPYNGFCAGISGSSIYIAETNDDVDKHEKMAAEGIRLIRQNAGLVPAPCIKFSDTFMCGTFLLECKVDAGTGEAYPVLPCVSLCNNYWSNTYCGSTTQLYYSYILTPAHQTAVDSAFPFCAPNGFFTAEPFPPDRYGVGRVIPNTLPYPIGIKGNLVYPEGTYTYTLQANGQNLTLPCREVAPYGGDLLEVVASCKFPLVTADARCAVPCPFPILEASDAEISIIAFVVPGVVALVLCVFVFMDSLWLIFESTGGEVGAFLRKYGFITTKGSTVHGSSAVDGGTTMQGSMMGGSMVPGSMAPGSMLSGGPSPSSPRNMTSGGAQSRGKRTQLRSSTLYALLGSVLGIIYFLVGPLPSLIRGHEISCAKQGQLIDFSGLINATDTTRDQPSGLCRAQRIMPFILQAIFNLTLYAMVKVLLVVTNSKMEEKQKRRLEIALFAYCAGVPILCLIISTQIDYLSLTLQSAIVQLTRDAVICVPRYENSGIEFALIFLPYIVTGLIVVGLSFRIYQYLKTVQKQVAGLQANRKQKTASDTALKLLLIRLGVLGVLTFVVLIVLMSVTGAVMIMNTNYGKSFYDWFACETAGRSCESCDPKKDQMMADRVPPAVLGVQLFMMSSIALLFGLFFGAQSASRLYKEFMDGSLQRKIDNIWYGRDIGDSSSFGGTNPGSAPHDNPNKQKSEQALSQVFNDNTVAAYMAAPFEVTSPVYHQERTRPLSADSSA